MERPDVSKMIREMEAQAEAKAQQGQEKADIPTHEQMREVSKIVLDCVGEPLAGMSTVAGIVEEIDRKIILRLMIGMIASLYINKRITFTKEDNNG